MTCFIWAQRRLQQQLLPPRNDETCEMTRNEGIGLFIWIRSSILLCVSVCVCVRVRVCVCCVECLCCWKSKIKENLMSNDRPPRGRTARLPHVSRTCPGDVPYLWSKIHTFTYKHTALGEFHAALGEFYQYKTTFCYQNAV